jgi:hypothetical protein
VEAFPFIYKITKNEIDFKHITPLVINRRLSLFFETKKSLTTKKKKRSAVQNLSNNCGIGENRL